MSTPRHDPGFPDGNPPAGPPPRVAAAGAPTPEPPPARHEVPSYAPPSWRRAVRSAFGGHRAWAAGEMRRAPLEVRVNLVVRTALLVAALLAGAVVLWRGRLPDEASAGITLRLVTLGLLLALALLLVVLVAVAASKPPQRVRAGFLRASRLDE